MTNTDEIKKVVLKNCEIFLKTRPPSPEYEDDVNAKRVIHEEQMKERIENYVEEMTLEMLNKLLKEVCKKKRKKY